MTPKDVNVLIPRRTCEHVILHGKRNFADVVRLRILRFGRVQDGGVGKP